VLQGRTPTKCHTPRLAGPFGPAGLRRTRLEVGAQKTLYWVGGTGNWSDATHWAGQSGGVGGGSGVPDINTDVVFDRYSSTTGAYTVTIDVSAFSRNITFLEAPLSGGTVTTAGAQLLNTTGSVVLLAGMTHNYSGTWNLSGTGSSTFKSNGIAIKGTTSFNSGYYTLLDNFNASGFNIRIAGVGTLDTNGFTVTGALGCDQAPAGSSLVLGATTWTIPPNGGWNASGLSNLFAGTSTIIVQGNGGFSGHGFTYNNVTVQLDNTAGRSYTIGDVNTFANLTLLANAQRDQFVTFSANQTIGTLKYLGNSVLNRLMLVSDVFGTARTLTVVAIDAASNFCDFRDIAGAGAAAPFATGTSLGDCLGNSGITFTPSVQQTATGTASFIWSTHGWTTRVPLPQDDVVINNAFIAGRTITVDMPRIGRSITMTCTGNPAFTPSQSITYFGSFIVAAGMTNTSNQTIAALGRGVHTLTTNGTNWTAQFQITTTVGVWTLGSAFNALSTNGTVFSFNAVGAGSFSTGNFNMTIDTPSVIAGFRFSAGTFNMGSSTITFLNSAGFQCLAGTINPGTSTFKYTDATATTKVFAGGGKTYWNLWFAGAGTGANQITGANTFNQFKADSNRVLQFTAATNTTAADWQIATGCTINSITAAQHTLTKSGGGTVSTGRAITVTNSIASPANTFYTGADSINGGSDVNWTFATASDTVGSSVGTATCSWVGQRIGQAVGACAGVATPSFKAQAVWQIAGVSAGVATVNGVGRSVRSAIGSSAGLATVLGIGRTVFGTVGHAVGSCSISGTAQTLFQTAGHSTATSVVIGVGGAIKNTVGNATGVATVTAVGAAIGQTTGNAAGAGTLLAIGETIFPARGSAAGLATVKGGYMPKGGPQERIVEVGAEGRAYQIPSEGRTVQ
jgi:hypothetical protein